MQGSESTSKTLSLSENSKCKEEKPAPSAIPKKVDSTNQPNITPQASATKLTDAVVSASKPNQVGSTEAKHKTNGVKRSQVCHLL